MSGNASAFENIMRGITGDDSYKFGDMTKKAATTASTTVATTIKDLTGKDATDYQFGDITKKAVASLAGKETFDDYQFGDITSRVLTDADKTIAGWRDDTFNDLMPQLWQQLVGRLSEQERGDLVVAMVQLIACFLLAFGLVLNLTVGASIAVAWAVSAFSARTSPLASGAAWSSFLTTHGTLRLGLDPLLFPVRALAALFLTRYYRRNIVWMQERLPFRDEQPVINRCLALALAWLLGNGLAVASLTAAVLWAISAVAGVPLR